MRAWETERKLVEEARAQLHLDPESTLPAASRHFYCASLHQWLRLVGEGIGSFWAWQRHRGNFRQDPPRSDALGDREGEHPPCVAGNNYGSGLDFSLALSMKIANGQALAGMLCGLVESPVP